MWILVIVLAMAFYAVSDIFAAKILIESKSKYSPIKLKIISISIGFIASLVIFLCGFGESGQTPVEVIIKNPLLTLSIVSNIISNLLYFFGVYYIGLTINESLSGMSNLFLFGELLIFYLINCRFEEVFLLSNPYKFVFIFIAMIGVILLPLIQNKSKKQETTKFNSKYIKGFAFSIVAVLFDSFDSLFLVMTYETTNIGTFDYLSSAYFFCFVVAIVLFIFLKVKREKIFTKNRKNNLYIVLSGVTFVCSTFLTIFAAYLNPLMSSLGWIVYPILPMIGAGIFLKEKYTLKENICIYTIFISSILFCVLDYI